MNTEPIYELQEFYLVHKVHYDSGTRPNDDYNVAKTHLPDLPGYHNIEFRTYEECLVYMRDCDTLNIAFQVQKLFRRVESTNAAYIMLNSK